jgi:hypothetical protein
MSENIQTPAPYPVALAPHANISHLEDPYPVAIAQHTDISPPETGVVVQARPPASSDVVAIPHATSYTQAREDQRVIPFTQITSVDTPRILARVTQAEAQRQQLSRDDALNVLDITKDWLSISTKLYQDANSVFTTPEFQSFYVSDSDHQDHLALNFDNQRNENIAFAHSLFRIFKAAARDPVMLQVVNTEVTSRMKHRGRNIDHTGITLFDSIRALVMSVHNRPFVGGRTFQSLMTSFVSTTKDTKGTWGLWTHMKPFMYITEELFAGLLMYTHLLVEAFTPANSASAAAAKATMYVKLGSPIYKQWLEPIRIAAGDDETWKLTDPRAIITRTFFRLSDDEMKALNTIRYQDTRDRAINKRKLNMDLWSRGVDALKVNISEFELRFPDWPDTRGTSLANSEENNHFWDLVIAALIATGSRQTEVFQITEFDLIPFTSDNTENYDAVRIDNRLYEKWMIGIKNVAKQRMNRRIDVIDGGKGRTAPLLYFGSDSIMKFICKIRVYLTHLNKGQTNAVDAWLKGTRTIEHMSTRITSRLTAYFANSVKSAKDLRAIWANITYDEYKPPEDRLLWIQTVLGHSDVGTAVSYSNWWTRKIPSAKRSRQTITPSASIRGQCPIIRHDGLTPRQIRVLSVYKRPSCIRRVTGTDVSNMITGAAHALINSNLPASYPNLRLLGFGTSSIQSWKHKQKL